MVVIDLQEDKDAGCAMACNEDIERQCHVDVSGDLGR